MIQPASQPDDGDADDAKLGQEPQPVATQRHLLLKGEPCRLALLRCRGFHGGHDVVAGELLLPRQRRGGGDEALKPVDLVPEVKGVPRELLGLLFHGTKVHGDVFGGASTAGPYFLVGGHGGRRVTGFGNPGLRSRTSASRE